MYVLFIYLSPVAFLNLLIYLLIHFMHMYSAALTVSVGWVFFFLFFLFLDVLLCPVSTYTTEKPIKIVFKEKMYTKLATEWLRPIWPNMGALRYSHDPFAAHNRKLKYDSTIHEIIEDHFLCI